VPQWCHLPASAGALRARTPAESAAGAREPTNGRVLQEFRARLSQNRHHRQQTAPLRPDPAELCRPAVPNPRIRAPAPAKPAAGAREPTNGRVLQEFGHDSARTDTTAAPRTDTAGLG